MCTSGDASKRCSDELEPAVCETSCCDDTSSQQCVDYIVGECLPDGNGGCQRSLGVEPCCTPSASTNGGGKDTCCSADQVTKSAEDACCVESICEDDCCEVKPGVVAGDCASACCDEPAAEAKSVCKDSCCGDDKSVSDAGACATGCCSGSKPDESVSEKDCCDAKSTLEAGECASTCCGGSGEKAGPDPCCTDKDNIGHTTCDDGPFVAEKGSHHVHNHSSAIIAPLHSHVAHSHSAGPTMRRRHGAHVHSATHNHESAEEHVHATSRKHRHVHKHAGQTSSKCGTQSAMSRFYEVACCCLISWANRHKHSTEHKGHKHSAVKEKKKDACCSTKPTTSSGKRATAHKSTTTRSHRHDHHQGHNHGSANVAEAAVPDCLELGDGKRLTMSLAIEGMDCPSCASKVTRALAKVRSVHDVKVNVFAGQASLAYIEGHAFPTEIAKKASEFTGFTCSILETVQANSERSSMRVRIPTTHQSSFDKNALPAGVAVLSSQTTRQGLMLEVEYSSLVIRPREVVAAFERWRGEFSPTPKVRAGDVADKELRNMFRRTGLSSLLCLPVLMLSWAPLPDHPKAYGGVMLALTTIIQFYIAAPVYSAGFRSLFYQRVLDMDVLISLSTFTAYIFSAVCYFLLLAGHKFSEAFFETSAVLISLIMLGRLISAYARRRATSALDALYSLQVDTVTLVSIDVVGLRSTTSVSAELIHKGDILLVAPGEIIPTDGIVSSGAGFIDESSITGESMPVEKTVNSPVTAGTKNGDAELLIRVDRLPSDNTVAEIGNLMLEVQNQRLRVQDLADKIAAWLAPVILAVALVTFSVWMAVGMKVRNEKASKAGVDALRYAISVMVVSCPCALVLCVPMVVVIATAVASKSGVLFKSAETIQTAKDANVVVFDKTGTLTTGVLAVAKSWVADDVAMPRLLALVAGSRHPVSQAVFSHLSAMSTGVTAATVTDIVSIPGQGLECKINGNLIRGGNATWLSVTEHIQVKNLISHALTVFAVTVDGALVAAFGLSDTVRPDAQMTVDIIKNRGGAVYIVSGDAQPVVDALAKTLGIPAQQAFGGCLPQDKLARVKQLQKEHSSDGGKKCTLMFVGDGTNDALALAQADVGVSFTTGTSVAASAAGILLLTPSLASAFRTIFAISAGAIRRIWVNFIWSFVYNLLAVLGAAGAFVNWSIKPEYAGLGEVVSVLPVVLIAWSMWMLKGRA